LIIRNWEFYKQFRAAKAAPFKLEKIMSNDNNLVKFSELALGVKFKYYPSIGDSVYVKLSNNRQGACVANWDNKLARTPWRTQGVYSLNDTGGDILVERVLL